MGYLLREAYELFLEYEDAKEELEREKLEEYENDEDEFLEYEDYYNDNIGLDDCDESDDENCEDEYDEENENFYEILENLDAVDDYYIGVRRDTNIPFDDWD